MSGFFLAQNRFCKIEPLQKRVLRFLYEDLWYEQLLQKAGKETMKVNRSRSLCIEIYKSISNINPLYMNEIFKLRKIRRAVRRNHKLNLALVIGVLDATGLKFGIRSLFK